MKPILEHRRKGIYLLPNLFTTAGLFAGFYAIVAAMRGHFDIAATAIFIAMVMDGLDGRIARLTHTESAFGAQYDSLADMVAFGAAPALVVYMWSLSTLKFGWLVAFIYAAAAALRLARFNTQIGKVDKRFFVGLATTPSAGVLAGYVWSMEELGIHTGIASVIGAVLTVMVGILMVSNVRYHGFKNIDLKGHVPFMALLVVVLIFVGISVDPPIVLFVIFAGYALSGPIWSLQRHGWRSWFRMFHRK
ncbi:MAG: CDP-diacylglycerol--serine O-phosphatidyltransferase [Gammaproteobacteria bacterium]